MQLSQIRIFATTIRFLETKTLTIATPRRLQSNNDNDDLLPIATGLQLQLQLDETAILNPSVLLTKDI